MQNNIAIKEKSLKHWWEMLSDYVWELFLANLLYLLCLLPAYAFIILFFLFNAWAFLIAGMVFLLPLGPAMLALHSLTQQIVSGILRSELTRFIASFKLHWKRGLLLSTTQIIACLLILVPAHFALITNSANKLPILACTAVAAMLLIFMYPHFCTLLIEGEHGDLLRKTANRALGGGKKNFLLSLLHVAWFFVCLLFPYGAVLAMLIALPTVLRLGTAYILIDNLQ